MKIPNKLLKSWLELKQEGDIGLLAEATGKSEPTVYKILRTGIAKVEDAEKIKGFFQDRKRKVNEILLDDNN